MPNENKDYPLRSRSLGPRPQLLGRNGAADYSTPPPSSWESRRTRPVAGGCGKSRASAASLARSERSSPAKSATLADTIPLPQPRNCGSPPPRCREEAMTEFPEFALAAVQATPVPFDRMASAEKAWA